MKFECRLADARGEFVRELGRKEQILRRVKAEA
jgi:hypothetical protein